MKHTLLLVFAIFTTFFFGCKKDSNRTVTPSIPATPSGYKTELIIDTSVNYIGGAATYPSTRNSFCIVQTGPTADSMYASYYSGATFTVDTNYNGIPLIYMVNPNWVSIGGSKFVAFFPDASYQLVFFTNSNGTGGLDMLPSQYLLITNGDTVNNFGH